MRNSVQLPPGWAKTSLTTVAMVNPTNPDRIPDDAEQVSFIPMADVEAGTGKLHTDQVRRWGDVKKGYKRFQDGDVLFAKITPCMENGKTALATGLQGGVGAGSTEYHVLRPTEAVGGKLLTYYLLQHAVRRDARAQMTGTAGQLRVPASFLEERELPLPPRTEQHRIVEAIESYLTRLDDAVASLERVRRNLERYRASVLKAAVEGRLVPTEAELARQEGRSYEPASELLKRILAERKTRWIEDAAEKARGKDEAKALKAGKPWTPEDDAKALEKARATAEAKYKEPAPPDLSALQAQAGLSASNRAQAGTADLPTLPQGWCWASVDQLAVVVRGASPRPAGDPRFFGGTIPWITVGDLTSEKTPYLREVHGTVTEAGAQASRFIPADTLLLTNSGATLGVPRISLIGGCINDGSVALLHVDYPLKLYVHHHLSTLTERLRRINQGAAQPNLNTRIVRAIQVSLPPAAEQQRILDALAEKLDLAVRQSAVVQAATRRCSRLRQAILSWAFEGKLVEQDPDDEPPSALLERIKANCKTREKSKAG